MSNLIAVLVCCGVLVLCVAYVAHSLATGRDWEPERWTTAAQALGLSGERDSNSHRRLTTFTGRIDGFAVSLSWWVDLFQGDAMARGSALQVQCGPLFGSLQAHPRPNLQFLENQRVPTLDQELDERTIFIGSEETLAACMNSTVRRALCHHFANGGRIEGGRLSCGRGLEGDPAKLEKSVADLVRLAKLLAVEDVPAALANNVLHDDVPAIRLRSLKLLIAHHRESPSCGQVLRAALADHDVEPRLLAARALGAEGQTALARMVENTDEALAIRIKALSQFVADAAPRDSSALLCFALRDDEWSLQQAALVSIQQQLGSRANEVALDDALLDALLAIAVASSASPTALERTATLRAAAETLAKFSGERVEQALVQLLTRDEDEVKSAAAKSLAAVGTVRAVEPLLAVPHRFPNGRAGEAARDAVREIQARLGDAEAGRLSHFKPLPPSNKPLSSPNKPLSTSNKHVSASNKHVSRHNKHVSRHNKPLSPHFKPLAALFRWRFSASLFRGVKS